MKKKSDYIIVVLFLIFIYGMAIANFRIEDKSYSVRRGAYYQISVPHIDGYTREMQEVFGKADADTTIDLIYTEE